MSFAVQLDFFQTPEQSELAELRKEMNTLRASGDKTRRAMFARHNELGKCVCEIAERLALLEHNICRGK